MTASPDLNAKKVGALVLPALTISRTSPQARALLTSLLLIEIGQTYGTSVGVTNQINTMNSAAGIVAALIMGFLSVRYSSRSLLLSGLVLSVVSVVGCCLAPSFGLLLILFSLGGFGANMIVPMSSSLIGDHFPASQRSKVMGWLMAGPAAIYIVGYPIGNYIGDWRRAYFLFALPILLLAFAFSFIGIPRGEKPSQDIDILGGYRGILAKKSALGCLVGYALALGVWTISLSLSSSFYRQQLGMSRTTVAYLTIAMAMAYIFGALIVGRIIANVGLRRTTLIMAFLLGGSTMLRFVFPNVYIAVPLGFLTCFFAGCFQTAVQGLSLEQVPRLRGSMMSLLAAFGGVGTVLILGLGGVLLSGYGWAVMGMVNGAFGVVAGAIYFFVKD